jgi:hypothetical protein
MFSAASPSPTHEYSLLENVRTFSISQSLLSLPVPDFYGVVNVSAADFVP